jgi:hypothetical protein
MKLIRCINKLGSGVWCNIVARSRNHCCSWDTTMRSVYCGGACYCQQYNSIACGTKMVLCRVYAAGNNETFSGLHVNCPTFLSDFNQIWSSWTDLLRSLQYQILRKLSSESFLDSVDRRTHGLSWREANSRSSRLCWLSRMKYWRRMGSNLCASICCRLSKLQLLSVTPA